jgi:carboxyl-terminal processing protease
MPKALNYILNMKRLPLLLLMLAGGIFLAFQTLGTEKSAPPSKYEKILQTVGVYLTQGHYSPKDINDEFSKKVFAKYFEELDPDKNVFLQSDIENLRKYETKIDDEIKGAPVEFFLAVSKVFNSRIDDAAKIYKDILSKPFDFKSDEVVVTDPKKLAFPKSDAERRESWRKKLKYLTLERFVELQDIRDKNKGKDSVVKTDAQLEKEARERVMKIMDLTFDRYRLKFNDDDKFSVFVNTITNMMDPYTEFFPPVDKRYFDEQLSGRFAGIGAQLQYDEGNIKIASVLSGYPAWKSGEIEVGDVIMKVAQAGEQPVDLTGYSVEDAVKLIRGKVGSTVNLTVKKKDGTIKNVTLTRAEIVQDETFARSTIVNNGTSKIGYIFLPEFYADFERPNGSRSAVDVAKEVQKLKEAKVDGIIIDLRNNGGGSLNDVVQMVGLFIPDGPVVQVRDREGKPMVLRDKDTGVLYDGPLAVMVNEFSASASEIFAAAIQDYGRGVVIGSTSTYGKGTVQRALGLDPESNLFNSNSDLGSLKLTLQKFYRINGGSTQLKGVASDIVIPDQYEYLHFRERDNDNALQWDEINKANYKAWNGGYDLQTVKNNANNRINSNPVFQQIKKNTEALSKLNDKQYSLQIDKFRKEQQELRNLVKQTDTLLKLQQPLNISYLPQDEQRINGGDKDKRDRYQNFVKTLSKDVYLDQAVKVLTDMQTQINVAARKGEAVKSF